MRRWRRFCEERAWRDRDNEFESVARRDAGACCTRGSCCSKRSSEYSAVMPIGRRSDLLRGPHVRLTAPTTDATRRFQDFKSCCPCLDVLVSSSRTTCGRRSCYERNKGKRLGDLVQRDEEKKKNVNLDKTKSTGTTSKT